MRAASIQETDSWRILSSSKSLVHHGSYFRPDSGETCERPCRNGLIWNDSLSHDILLNLFHGFFNPGSFRDSEFTAAPKADPRFPLLPGHDGTNYEVHCYEAAKRRGTSKSSEDSMAATFFGAKPRATATPYKIASGRGGQPGI